MSFNACMWYVKLLCDLSLVSYYAGYFLSLLLSCRRELQLGVQSVVHLRDENVRNENEQTNSGTGVLLMIFHHKHHTTFSELALRLKFGMKKNEFKRLKSSNGKKRNDIVSNLIHQWNQFASKFFHSNEFF